MSNSGIEASGRELSNAPSELREPYNEIVELTRFEELERKIISVMLELLDEVKREKVESLLSTYAEIHLVESEMQEILKEVKLAVEEIRKQGVQLAALEQTMEVILGPDVSTKTRMKLMIPIIPFLLHLETEVELSNRHELKAIWKRFVKE